MIFEAGIERVEARGGDHSWAKAEMLWTGFDLGHWGELLARADGLLEQWDGESVQYVPWAKSYRARVKVWRGDISEAAALQDDYLPALREIQDLQLLTAALSISARIELARGDAVAAVGLLDEFFAVTEGKSPMYRALYMTDVVRLLIETGDVEKAREWAAGSIGPGLRNRISSATTEAMLAEASGDHEGALTGYDEAAAAWAEFGFVLEQALALYGAGRSLTALDRSGEAAERLDAARRILSELGATPMIDEIDGVADQAAAL
jgi:tetratricopeptide (TPR) repeat protein